MKTAAIFYCLLTLIFPGLSLAQSELLHGRMARPLTADMHVHLEALKPGLLPDSPHSQAAINITGQPFSLLRGSLDIVMEDRDRLTSQQVVGAIDVLPRNAPNLKLMSAVLRQAGNQDYQLLLALEHHLALPIHICTYAVYQRGDSGSPALIMSHTAMLRVDWLSISSNIMHDILHNQGSFTQYLEVHLPIGMVAASITTDWQKNMTCLFSLTIRSS